MNICEPILERYAIYDSYACRKGKGTIKAIERAGTFSRRDGWYLKLDIRLYFDSIDQEILLNLLRRRFKDQQLLALLGKILAGYHTSPGKGLPIGNLVSQHLANYYLGHLDHWIKEDLQVRYYLRYMDDFILFGRTRKKLKTQLDDVRYFLDKQLKLRLKGNVQLNRSEYGIPFLGFRVYPHITKLSTQSKKRFREKYRKYEQQYLAGKWNETELIHHIEPLFGFTFAASSKSYRNHVIQRYGVLS